MRTFRLVLAGARGLPSVGGQGRCAGEKCQTQHNIALTSEHRLRTSALLLVAGDLALALLAVGERGCKAAADHGHCDGQIVRHNKISGRRTRRLQMLSYAPLSSLCLPAPVGAALRPRGVTCDAKHKYMKSQIIAAGAPQRVDSEAHHAGRHALRQLSSLGALLLHGLLHRRGVAAGGAARLGRSSRGGGGSGGSSGSGALSVRTGFHRYM